MAIHSDASDAACADLIKATEKSLTGSKLKTVLSIVWSRNILETGFWCFYWYG